MLFSNRNQNGFTLVELLVAMTTIGILCGITIAVVNQQQQRARAQDAVNRNQLEHVSQGIESYMATEGKYPPENSGAAVAPSMSEYLSSWPTTVTYIVTATLDNFDVYMPSSDGNYLKYSSVWGTIKRCTSAAITTVGSCTAVP